MKIGQGSVASRAAGAPGAGAKWKTCCCVTVSGGSSHQPVEQRRDPGAGRDGDHRGGEGAAVGVRDGAVAGLRGRQAGDRGLEAHVGAAGRRQPEHRGDRAIGVEHAGVGVEHDLFDPVEVELGPALRGRARGHQLGGHAAAGEHRVQLPRVPGRAEVEPAGQREQALAGLGRQLAPALARLPGQPHVQRVRVGATEDPRAAVRAPVAVRGAERVEHDDVAAALGGGVRGGGAGQPRADDDQVRARWHGFAASRNESGLSGEDLGAPGREGHQDRLFRNGMIVCVAVLVLATRSGGVFAELHRAGA